MSNDTELKVNVNTRQAEVGLDRVRKKVEGISKGFKDAEKASDGMNKGLSAGLRSGGAKVAGELGLGGIAIGGGVIGIAVSGVIIAATKAFDYVQGKCAEAAEKLKKKIEEEFNAIMKDSKAGRSTQGISAQRMDEIFKVKPGAFTKEEASPVLSKLMNLRRGTTNAEASRVAEEAAKNVNESAEFADIAASLLDYGVGVENASKLDQMSGGRGKEFYDVMGKFGTKGKDNKGLAAFVAQQIGKGSQEDAEAAVVNARGNYSGALSELGNTSIYSDAGSIVDSIQATRMRKQLTQAQSMYGEQTPFLKGVETGMVNFPGGFNDPDYYLSMARGDSDPKTRYETRRKFLNDAGRAINPDQKKDQYGHGMKDGDVDFFFKKMMEAFGTIEKRMENKTQSGVLASPDNNIKVGQ